MRCLDTHPAICASGDDDNQTVRERPLLTAEANAKPKRPPLYAVILLNDDYTPREFVTIILKMHFGSGRRCGAHDHDARSSVW